MLKGNDPKIIIQRNSKISELEKNVKNRKYHININRIRQIKKLKTILIF